jgi:hypothetical protein
MLATDSLLLILERKYMHGTFSELKSATFGESLAKAKIFLSSELEFRIVPVGAWIFEHKQYLDQIVELRNLNCHQYFYSDPVSLQSTRTYFKKTVLPDASRVWFLVVDANLSFLGHFGYSNYEPHKNSASLDSVAKVASAQVKIKDALDYSFSYLLPELKISKLSLEVLSSNKRAICLYEKLGFRAEPESQITRMGKNGTSMSLLLQHD